MSVYVFVDMRMQEGVRGNICIMHQGTRIFVIRVDTCVCTRHLKLTLFMGVLDGTVQGLPADAMKLRL